MYKHLVIKKLSNRYLQKSSLNMKMYSKIKTTTYTIPHSLECLKAKLEKHGMLVRVLDPEKLHGLVAGIIKTERTLHS